MDGRARLAELARPLLGKLPDGPLHELMQARLVELSGVHKHTGVKTISHKQGSKRKADQRLSPTATAISLLVQYPHLAATVPLPKLVTASEYPGAQLLGKIHAITRKQGEISTAVLLERFRDQNTFHTLEKLAASNHLLEEDKVLAYFRETLDTLEEQAVSLAITELLGVSSKTGLDQTGKDQLARLYKHRETLREAKKNA